MFSPIDAFPIVPATLDLCFLGLQARLILGLVVERCHEHVPSFAALRVVAVVAHDEPLDAVILRINLCHEPNGKPAERPSPLNPYGAAADA